MLTSDRCGSAPAKVRCGLVCKMIWVQVKRA